MHFVAFLLGACFTFAASLSSSQPASFLKEAAGRDGAGPVDGRTLQSALRDRNECDLVATASPQLTDAVQVRQARVRDARAAVHAQLIDAAQMQETRVCDLRALANRYSEQIARRLSAMVA